MPEKAPTREIEIPAAGARSEPAPRPKMRAARLHRPGEPLSIDLVERPVAGPTDVVIQVKACGVVPNMATVFNLPRLFNLADLPADSPRLVTPNLPAILGLDAAGVIVERGSQVRGVELGDRVYVDPARYCGSCRPCRSGNGTACKYFLLNGYMGLGELSPHLFDDHPYGGFAEFMPAPQYSLVKLPDNLSFETAARWGYLGTSYAALRRAGVDMRSTVLINGITGTLGLGAALFALALGARKILGLGRNAQLLQRVRELCPDRIHVRPIDGEESVRNWARTLTEGDGVDVVVDALPTGAPPASFRAAFAALARGGRHVNIGGVLQDVATNVLKLVNDSQTIMGSLWFTTAQGQEMAELAANGSVKLDVFEHEVFALEEINSALARIATRHGGFSNYVISPEPQALTERGRW